MPVFTFRCGGCGAKIRTIQDYDKIEQWAAEMVCECGGGVGRDSSGVNVGANVVEKIDNGIMAKAVERPARIREKIHERIAVHEGRIPSKKDR